MPLNPFETARTSKSLFDLPVFLAYSFIVSCNIYDVKEKK